MPYVHVRVVGVAFGGLKMTLWGIAAVGWLAMPGPAHAQESIPDLFKDLVMNGCIASLEAGMPIDTYAQGVGLEQPHPQLAAAFLRGRPGSAYIKPTSRTVLIIAETADTCTVSSRVAPDLVSLIQSVEIGLALLPNPFKLVKEGQQPLMAGGTAATREYDGLIGRRPYGVLLVTTATGSPQATATVFRKAR